MMTKEQLAEILDGREHLREITGKEEKLAREAGLAVVFGYGNNTMQFDGALIGGLEVWEGGTVHLDEKGFLENLCEDDECPYFEKAKANCKTIRAIWRPPNGGSWAYETEIPHATFRIMEGGELYCTEIVFEMGALKRC